MMLSPLLALLGNDCQAIGLSIMGTEGTAESEADIQITASRIQIAVEGRNSAYDIDLADYH